MINLISVIIPNYNHEKYLNLRINSVLNQSYQDFELIILDDFSSDNSKTIIEQYRNHPKVTNIIYNEINSGNMYLQWEKGIKEAKGDYVWIADSDDYVEDTFLASLIEIICANINIGLVYCGSNTVDENGIYTGKLVREVQINHDHYYLNNGHEECKNAFFFHPIIPTASAVIFKRENFKHVNPSFKQYKICGDWQFWIDICFDNYIAYLPQCLSYFRQSNTSVSRSNHYRKDNYKIFLLEKLRVGLYSYRKVKNKISLKNRIKYIDIYLFSVLLESFRKRIFLSRLEIVFIFKYMLYLSPISLLVFFKSLTDVCLFALRKVKRKVKEKWMVKTA